MHVPTSPTRDMIPAAFVPEAQGAWVEIDDNEQMIFVDLDCTQVPDVKEFVRQCHFLAGELGYGIQINEAS